MENTIENAKLYIFREKDESEGDGVGAALRRSLVPSQLYVIDKTSEIVSSFYYNLVEPTAVYTITKSASKFIYELLLSKVESLDKFISNKNSKKFARLGGFDLDDLCKKINVLGNRPLWIDDTEIQSVEELCEKCRQMKEEHHIQFVVIDDFLHLPIPKRVLEGRETPDAVNKLLCRLAKELDIAVVALVDQSANDINKHCKSRRRKKRKQKRVQV